MTDDRRGDLVEGVAGDRRRGRAGSTSPAWRMGRRPVTMHL